MKSKVYIAILNYNGWKDTIECIESVLKSSYKDYQIIVVDNKSANDSMRHILGWAKGKQKIEYCANTKLKHMSQPEIKKPLSFEYRIEDNIIYSDLEFCNSKQANPIIFIQSQANNGFAAGNNIAIKYALEKNDFKYIWLLNNDTTIRKDTLCNLLNFATAKNIGIAGSVLMDYENPDKVQAYGGAIDKKTGRGGHIVMNDELEYRLDYIIGASFLIDKQVIDSIGLLPEEYFLYYEETDYCFKALKNSFKIGVSVNSLVYHKEGASTGLKKASSRSELSDFLLIRNRIIFHKKYLKCSFCLWVGVFRDIVKIALKGKIKRAWNVSRKIFIKGLFR